MRRSIIILIVIMMLVLLENSVVAEVNTEDRILAQIAAQLEVLNHDLKTEEEQIQNPDAQILFDLAKHAIIVCQSIHIEAMGDDGVVLPESLKDLYPRETYCGGRDDGAFSQTENVWLQDMKVYANSDAIYRNGYLSAKYSIYDEEGIYLGTQRVEYGRRNSEILMLIVDYDNTMGATGRFALKIEDGNAEVIFTKTLGMHMDIVLDVDEWQRGEDIVKWEKSLLLPSI